MGATVINDFWVMVLKQVIEIDKEMEKLVINKVAWTSGEEGFADKSARRMVWK